MKGRFADRPYKLELKPRLHLRSLRGSWVEISALRGVSRHLWGSTWRPSSGGSVRRAGSVRFGAFRSAGRTKSEITGGLGFGCLRQAPSGVRWRHFYQVLGQTLVVTPDRASVLDERGECRTRGAMASAQSGLRTGQVGFIELRAGPELVSTRSDFGHYETSWC